MSELLFDIFGDRLSNNSTRTLPRQPLSNNENMGKTVSTGPVKPNEPLKKAGEMKKSFLANTGRALRDIQTPVQKVYSPRCRNIDTSTKKVLKSQLIYSDELDEEARKYYEELEFTKPKKCDNYHTDLLDCLLGPELPVFESPSPPSTPPPTVGNRSMEFIDCSYEDEFFIDDFNVGIPFVEDELPGLFNVSC